MPDLFEAVGNEVRVNGGQFSYFGQQIAPQATRLANGDLVVVFTSDSALKTQRYDPAGNAVGGEVTITAGLPSGIFSDAAITSLSGGGYAITWTRQLDQQVFAQVYDAAGSAQGVPTQLGATMAGIEASTSVSALTGGGFVVAWTNSGQDGNGLGTYMQRFDAAGAAIGSPALVNVTTAGDQTEPAVAALDGGGFVITWRTYTPNSAITGEIMARVYDAAGAPVGGEIAVNLTTQSEQSQPAISALAGGGFAIVWTSFNQDRPGGSGIILQRFDASGVRLGGETVVNSFVDGSQNAAAIARLSNGDFVVSWTSSIQDGSGSGVYAQVYSGNGVAQGGEFRASTATSGDQLATALVGTADGGFAVVYESPDPSGSGVNIQRFVPSAGLATFNVAGTLSVTEAVPGSTVVADLSTNQANDLTLFSIVADSSGGAFGIAGNRLIVADNGWLDFETQTSVTLTLRATSSNGQLIDRQIVVQVSDSAEETRFSGQAIHAVSTIGSMGADEGIRAIALSGGGYAVAWIDYNQGVNQNQYAVSVRVLDANGAVVNQSQTLIGARFAPQGPVLTALSGNSFVVGWTYDLAAGAGFSMQFFDGNGIANGGPVIVDPSATFRTAPNDMVALADGSLLAVSYQFNTTTSQTDIMTRHFSATGQVLDAGTVVTDTAAREYRPTAAALTGGGYVLSWGQDIPGQGGFQTYFQRFAADGTPAGAAQLVASAGGIDVAALSSGGFVLVFGASLNGQTGRGYFQIYDAAGIALGGPTVFAPNLGSSGVEFSVAGTPDGGFVIESLVLSAMKLQRFSANGTELGPATVLGNTPYSAQGQPEVAASATGSFIAAWTDPNGSTTNGYVDRMWQVFARESLYGTELTDSLTGTAANERAFGYGGDDTLNGGGGSDRLYGGAGNDILIAEVSDLVIDGGAGTDTVRFAASGAVTATLNSLEAIELVGGASLTLSAAQFNAGFYNPIAQVGMASVSGTGSLILNLDPNPVTAALYLTSLSFAGGSSVTLTINGTSGLDAIKGAPGVANTINGGDEADQIRGGSLADTINGGNGNDKLFGWSGADTLTGGAGSDQFRYFFATDSGTGAAADRITDFQIGVDKFNFVIIDADPITPDDQAFAFLGTGAFTSPGTGQIRYQDSGANLLVQVDVDGNGTVDMEVVLQGLAGQALTSGDFML